MDLNMIRRQLKQVLFPLQFRRLDFEFLFLTGIKIVTTTFLILRLNFVSIFHVNSYCNENAYCSSPHCKVI